MPPRIIRVTRGSAGVLVPTVQSFPSAPAVLPRCSWLHGGRVLPGSGAVRSVWGSVAAYDPGVVYPTWAYFPRQSVAPDWVSPFLAVVGGSQTDIDSTTHKTLESDRVVASLRDGLVLLGWEVEAGKRAADKIHRPVLFGDNGHIRVKQEIDGWHPELRIVLEVESGRGVQGNAIYQRLGSCVPRRGRGEPDSRCQTAI